MRDYRFACAFVSAVALVAILGRSGNGKAGGADPHFAQNPDEKSKSSAVKNGLAPTKRVGFKPPQLSPADLLATGSQRVYVTLNQTPTPIPKACWLLRLEKSWVILRDMPLQEPTITTAASKKITEIATTDGKYKWKFNAEKKVFEGKVQASPATEEVLVASRPAIPRQVEQFLLLSFRRLMNRGIDGIADAPSPSDVAEVRLIAAKRAETIARSGYDADIADLYAKLPRVLEIYSEQAAKQDQLIADYNAKIKVQLAERRKLADRQAIASMTGMFKIFAGAMPDRQVVRGTFGQLYLVDRGPVSPELMNSGMRDLADASRNGASQLEMLNRIKEMTDQKQREAMSESLTIQLEAVTGLRLKFDEIAHVEYKIPKLDPIPQEEWNKPRRFKADYQPLIDRLDAFSDREKEGLGYVNPFARFDLIYFQSLVPVPNAPEQAEHWQSLARDTIKLVSEIPADPILDYDRAELLTNGAELALRGAEVELGLNRWLDAFHPRAVFASKLLDLALRYFPDDPSGRIREKMAQARLLGGRVEEALKLALEVEGLRKNSPRYYFQLARIKCAAGLTDKGLDDLETAVIVLGFADLDEARRRGGDFPQAQKRYKELTEIKLVVDGKVPQGFNVSGPRVVVTNRSRFPLTDVLVEVGFEKIIQKATANTPMKTDKLSYLQRIARLDPNETMIIEPGKVGPIVTLKDGTILGQVQLSSRQGKSKIYSSH
jgi:hypothetical protein